MDATTQISIRGNWNKTNALGIVPVTVSRTTEIQVALQARPSKAGQYKFEPPTYLAPDGTLKAMVWCSACGDWKQREAFYRNRARPNGLDSECRKCSNPEIARRMRDYRARQKAARIAA